jgi:hypothetical protein
MNQNRMKEVTFQIFDNESCIWLKASLCVHLINIKGMQPFTFKNSLKY